MPLNLSLVSVPALLDTSRRLSESTFSPNGRYMLYHNSGDYWPQISRMIAFDLADPNNIVMNEFNLSMVVTENARPVIDNDGTVYYGNHSLQQIGSTWKRANMGADAEVLVESQRMPNSTSSDPYVLKAVAQSATGTPVLIYSHRQILGETNFYTLDVATDVLTLKSGATIVGQAQSDYWGTACDQWGDCWTVSLNRIDAENAYDRDSCYIWRVHDGGQNSSLPQVLSVTDLPFAESPGGYTLYGALAHIPGYFVFQWTYNIYCLINDSTGEVAATFNAATEFGWDQYDDYNSTALQNQVSADGSRMWLFNTTPSLLWSVHEILLPSLTKGESYSISNNFATPAAYSDPVTGYWPYTLSYVREFDGFTLSGIDFPQGGGEVTSSIEFLVPSENAVTGDVDSAVVVEPQLAGYHEPVSGGLSGTITALAGISGLATAPYVVGGKVFDVREGRGDLVILGKSFALPSSSQDDGHDPLDGSIRFNPETGWVQLWVNEEWIDLGGSGTSEWSVEPQRILGRSLSTVGPVQQLTVGDGLLLDGNTLSFTVSNVRPAFLEGTHAGLMQNAGKVMLGFSPKAFTLSGTNTTAKALEPAAGAYRITILKKAGNATPVIVGYFDWNSGERNATTTIVAGELAEVDLVYLQGDALADFSLRHLAFVLRA